MRGKITKQELNRSLIAEMESHTKYIVSEVEPKQNVHKGTVWFNPKTQVSKLFFNNEFITISLGFNTSEGVFTTRTSRVNVTTKSNEVNIDIEGLSTTKGVLTVMANGVHLYPEDYIISEDGTKITKTNGFWEKTDFLFTYYISVDLRAGVIPHIRPKREESIYEVMENETNIPINIINFDPKKDKLDLYLNGLMLHEGIDYNINENNISIDVNKTTKKNDKFYFKTWIEKEIQFSNNVGIEVRSSEPTDKNTLVWYKIIS